MKTFKEFLLKEDPDSGYVPDINNYIIWDYGKCFIISKSLKKIFFGDYTHLDLIKDLYMKNEISKEMISKLLPNMKNKNLSNIYFYDGDDLVKSDFIFGRIWTSDVISKVFNKKTKYNLISFWHYFDEIKKWYIDLIIKNLSISSDKYDLYILEFLNSDPKNYEKSLQMTIKDFFNNTYYEIPKINKNEDKHERIIAHLNAGLAKELGLINKPKTYSVGGKEWSAEGLRKHSPYAWEKSESTK